MAAAYEVRRRRLDPEPLYAIGLIVVLSALVGGRVFYLLEHGLLDEPGEWLSTTGFTFYGGFIAAALGIAYYVRRNRLSLSYLDAIAAGLPLGVAVGRIGDVINGEHYGPATEFFLGVRNTHPEALTPSPELAYHSGGLYEVLLASIVFAIAWPLRKRLTRPLALMWLVVALFAAGRFAQFFWRSDSDTVALGLETAQWTSLALLAVAAVGAWLTLARRPATSASPRVELLWWSGCPNWEGAREILREEMAAVGLDPDRLEVREVKTDEAAERMGSSARPRSASTAAISRTRAPSPPASAAASTGCATDGSPASPTPPTCARRCAAPGADPSEDADEVDDYETPRTVDGIATEPDGTQAAWFNDSEGNLLVLVQFS